VENPDPHRISTEEQLDALLGAPHPTTRRKLLTALDEMAIGFIQRSPLLVIGTADADGNQDVSPKGDHPGFVQVAGPNTLLIPERKGNKLKIGFRNVLANPHVGLIFLVPNTDETLRVNGTAELTADPALLATLPARGSSALLAMRVTVRECFFHCGKAFIRSALWQPETWAAHTRMSFGKQLGGGAEDLARKIDQAIEQDYKNNL
jgi:PPOX class probable FMN-dependent enzyme